MIRKIKVKKSTRKRNSKVNKISRGGFQNQLPVRSISNHINKKIGSGKFSIHNFESIGKVGRVLRALNNAEYSLNRGGPTIKVKLADNINLVNNGSDVVRSSTETVKTIPVIGGSSQITKRVDHVTGKAPSQVIKRLAKNEGTRKQTWVDTPVTEQGVGVGGVRSKLNFASGFNGKLQIFPNDVAHTTINTAFGMYGINMDTEFYKPWADKIVRVYANTIYFEDEYRITNNNAYFPIKVRVHLTSYRGLDTPSNAHDTMILAVNPSQNLQDQRGMPIYMQQTVLTDNSLSSADPGFSHVDVDPKTPGVKASPVFKTEFNIVKSDTVWLDPGDSLIYKHRHYTGPGLRLDKIVEFIRMSQEAVPDVSKYYPLSYYPWFEVVGGKANAVTWFASNDPSAKFEGTAPAYISMEYTKRSLAVSRHYQSGIFNDGVVDPTGGRFEVGEYSIRTYVTQPTNQGTNPAKRFYVPTDKILDNNDAPGINTYLVPVMTDAQQRFAGVSMRRRFVP